jgi:hypothetical protein
MPAELRQADHNAVIAWERFMRESEHATPSTIRRRGTVDSRTWFATAKPRAIQSPRSNARRSIATKERPWHSSLPRPGPTEDGVVFFRGGVVGVIRIRGDYGRFFKVFDKYPRPVFQRLIPLAQVRLYVVGAARGTGRRVCEDCLA